MSSLTAARRGKLREQPAARADELDDELRAARAELWRKVEELVTEDDTPVDNLFSEREQKLLTDALYASWRTMAGKKSPRKFLALANVGIFPVAEQEAVLVPDVLLSLDVEAPADVKPKRHRSYFLWLYGKPPDVVIEIVSNRKGGELSGKKLDYARMRVPYYVVHDPARRLSLNELTIFELQGGSYVRRKDAWLPDVGLGLKIVEGEYEGVRERWLRWCDAKGKLLATALERSHREGQRAQREARRAKRATQRATQEAARAKQEAARANQEAARAAKLAAKLKELGIDPTKL